MQESEDMPAQKKPFLTAVVSAERNVDVLRRERWFKEESG